MSYLGDSYRAQAKAIETRGSVWCDTYSGKWYHSYDHGLVNNTIQRLLAYADAHERSYVRRATSRVNPR